MTEIQAKSILVRVSEGSSYRESTVYSRWVPLPLTMLATLAGLILVTPATYYAIGEWVHGSLKEPSSKFGRQDFSAGDG